MIGEIFSLFLNAPKVVRIKVYPYFNRLLIKKVGGHWVIIFRFQEN